MKKRAEKRQDNFPQHRKAAANEINLFAVPMAERTRNIVGLQ